MMMKTQTTSFVELRLQAQELLPFVRTWLAAVNQPDDRGLKIQLRLLQKQGAHLCPQCDTAFRLENLRSTRTAFTETEIMRCATCRTQFVMREEHIA
ncbi:MAG: hypothetical protein GY822_21575 [Deltaproteobacteria bacterium]|nr:hypothetical protein [Deltaproteobacteria bacterium]